jgi:hypothetical protein
MTTVTKVKIVRSVLIATGIFLLVNGLGHIFFSVKIHEIVGGGAIFDINNPWIALAAREMGVLFSVIGIAACIAAINPLKHKWLVFMVVLASLLSDVVRGLAVLSGTACPKLWIVVVVSIILWLLIVVFYPYKEAGEQRELR